MSTQTNSSVQPIAFILDNVADYEAMAASLAAGYEVYILDSSGDALAQMASILDGRSGIEAIHLVSHGQAGVLDMGTLSLSLSNLSANSASLATIGSALSADADFLIYGCDVAAGEAGQAFVTALAEATGADVAASVDTTGPAATGGNADLESHTGSIEAASIDGSLFQTNLGPTPVFSDSYGLLNTYNDTVNSDVFSSIDGTLTASVAPGEILTFSGTASQTFGVLTVNADGTFTFVPNATAINALADGESQTETFAVTVTDSDGHFSSKDLTVTFIGANDDPSVVASLTAVALQEDGASNGWTGPTDLSGTLSIIDVDSALPDLSNLRYVIDGAASYDDGGNMMMAGQGGTLYLDTTTGQYVYAPSVNLINALTDGQTMVDTFTFSVTGVAGTVATGTFSVVVTGSNDAPVITLEAPTATLVEAGGLYNGITGIQGSQIGVMMSDAEGAANVDVSTMVSQGWSLNDGSTALIQQGVYGTAELTLSNGLMIYVLNNSGAATQALTGGQTVSESFLVHIIDGQGVGAQASALFSITGTDDAPELHLVQAPVAATYIDGNGQEQINYNRTGMLSLVDVDTDVASYGTISYAGLDAITDDGGNAMMTGYFGNLYINSYTGQFDFVGNVAAIEALAEGQLGQEVFQLNMADAGGVIGTSVYEVQFIGVAPPIQA